MAPRKPTQTRRPTRARKPRHQRPQQQPSGPRVTVQVAEFPLSQQATAEPSPRGRVGRRYDTRMEARKGATRGPKLRVRPAVLVRLVMVAAAALILLALLQVAG